MRNPMTPIYGIIAAVKRFQTLLWIAVACVALADGQPFERYKTIIDRMPFGPEPAGFDPDAAPGSESTAAAAGDGEMTPEQRSAEEQQLASNVRVSILNVTPAGVVKVGFTDSSAKPPENYYLKVGASQNGWTVKAADPAAESVTLEKGGVEVTVKLGESSGGGGKGNGKGSNGGKSAGRPQMPQRRGGHPMMGGGGLAKLRMQRMQEEKMRLEDEERKRKAEAEEKAKEEEREAKAAAEKQAQAEEREQQREAIRQLSEQISEQMRKQREERERREQQERENEDNDN
jgi:hypothetical protein